jgi:hypothetical protein
MRYLILTAAMLFSSLSFGASIDPEDTNLSWRNGPTRDSVYKMTDHPGKVHVFEALKNSCGWCHKNAPLVDEMAVSYAEDEQVAFVDLSLDTSNSEIQRWLSRHTPSYPFTTDNGNVWSALKQANGIPQTFVVDCNGTMVGGTVGYWGSTGGAKIKRFIAQAKRVTCIN